MVTTEGDGGEMTPWEKLLEQPHARGHFVQLYTADERALTNNVGQYLWQGLRRGEGALVIVTPEHRKMFCECLDRLCGDVSTLLKNRQLVLWDAEQTLSEFISAGQPDPQRFKNVICAAMRQLRPARNGGLRSYGEMVGILWKGRQFAAAIRLEQLWNRLLEQFAFSLYCAYAIDIFDKGFATANLDAVLSTHTHLIPAQPDGRLEDALDRSMAEILGSEAAALRDYIKSDRRPGSAVMPTAEAMVLWLRKNLPGQADRIFARFRHHYFATEVSPG
jgi:hypothetical protein